MRAANNGDGPSGRTAGVREAIEALQPSGVQALIAAGSTPTTSSTIRAPGRIATSAFAATRWPSAAPPSGSPRSPGWPQRDELAVAALLHDVGKLVLVELYGDELPRRRP